MTTKEKKKGKKPTGAELKAAKIAEAIAVITTFFMKYTTEVGGEVKKLQLKAREVAEKIASFSTSGADMPNLDDLYDESYRFYTKISRVMSVVNSIPAQRRQMLYSPEVWTKFLGRFKDFSVSTEDGGRRLVFLLPVPTFHLSYKGLRKVPFKNMKIQITLSPDLSYARSRVAKKQTGKPFHKGKTPHYHPHVNEAGDICYGAGTATMQMLQNRWDTISMYTEVLQILHTYNAPGVYSPLESFTNAGGGRCGDCHRWIPFAEIKDTTVKCPSCKALHCLKCSKKFAAQKTTTCVVCSKTESDDIKTAKICMKCRAERKRKGRQCRVCKGEVCSKHRIGCPDCGNHVCTECKKTCPVCTCDSCGNHLPSDSSFDILREHDVCNYCRQTRPNTIKSVLREKGVSDEDIEKTGL